MTDTRDTAAPQPRELRLNFHRLTYSAYPRMDFNSQPGTRVVFDALGGYASEQERALDTLTQGQSYEVERCNVGSCSSSVKLRGVDGLWNTVMFAASPTAPPPTQPEGHEAWMEQARELIDDLVCASNAAVLCFARYKSTPEEYHRLKDLCDAAEDALLAHLRTKGE
jgi:hypothetical protein